MYFVILHNIHYAQSKTARMLVPLRLVWSASGQTGSPPTCVGSAEFLGVYMRTVRHCLAGRSTAMACSRLMAISLRSPLCRIGSRRSTVPGSGKRLATRRVRGVGKAAALTLQPEARVVIEASPSPPARAAAPETCFWLFPGCKNWRTQPALLPRPYAARIPMYMLDTEFFRRCARGIDAYPYQLLNEVLLHPRSTDVRG